jgi:hypothetical protein
MSMFDLHKSSKLEIYLLEGLFWIGPQQHKNVLPMRNGEIFGSGEQIESHRGNFSSMAIAILDRKSTGNLAINFYLRSFCSVILYYLISFKNKNKCIAKTSANLCLQIDTGCFFILAYLTCS